MANTLTSLNTAFRYIQEKKLLDLKPNSSIVYDLAPMKESDQLGRKYLAPVVLSFELGFTFGDGGAFAYNNDVAGVYSEIQIDPNPVVLKSRLSIEAADRMAGSEKAVINHVALRSGQMKASLMKMAEIEMLHGRTGLGAISTSTVSTNATITFTDATWAPGIWGGMEGALLDAYTTGASKVNSNADLVLVSVNFASKQIVVSGNNTDLVALAVTNAIFFKGAYSTSQYGIKYQLSTSGSIFGIDNSVYALWKAQSHSVSGALTMGQVLAGRAKAVARAGLDEDTVLLVSATTFENLNTDLAALRMFDESYSAKVGESGAKGIVYHGQGGSIRVIAHPMLMEGDAFLLPERGMKRIGATDVTFKSIDGDEDAWKHLEGYHAYQLTGRYSFQVLISEPAKCVYFSGIVNT